jgi:hypothetical protein
MAFDVSTADIEARWRVLDDDETDVGLQRLMDADRKLRGRRPTLQVFYDGLTAGTAKTDLLETIRSVLAEAVIRFLRNPDVNNRQDIGADGGIGIGFDTLTPGGVYFTDEEMAEIDAAVAAANGTTYPRVRSRVLASSFPYRTIGDVTILPTP